MTSKDEFVSFANYAREQTADPYADIKLPPARDYLQNIVQAFWNGEFEGDRFADREQMTAIVRLTPPKYATEDLHDDRHYDDSGHEIFKASWGYEPVTRELMRLRLCISDCVPAGMKPLWREGSWPPFSYFADAPISRYLEYDDPADLKGFEYFAELSVRCDDLDRWIETPGRAEAADIDEIDAGVDIAARSKSRAWSAAKLREWYLCWVAGNEEKERIPSAEEDWAAAKSEFNKNVPRSAVRDLRREHAPESWRRRGRRKLPNKRH